LLHLKLENILLVNGPVGTVKILWIEAHITNSKTSAI